MNRYKMVKAGIDVNEGIHRFNGKKEMYEKFLLNFPQNDLYGKLVEAIDNQDVKEAFQAGHALKGVTGNLSMKEFHDNLVPLVEELRADSLEHAKELLEPVAESYKKVMEVLQAE